MRRMICPSLFYAECRKRFGAKSSVVDHLSSDNIFCKIFLHAFPKSESGCVFSSSSAAGSAARSCRALVAAAAAEDADSTASAASLPPRRKGRNLGTARPARSGQRRRGRRPQLHLRPERCAFEIVPLSSSLHDRHQDILHFTNLFPFRCRGYGQVLRGRRRRRGGRGATIPETDSWSRRGCKGRHGRHLRWRNTF